MIKKVEISHRTILFTIFAVLSVLFLYKIADILFQFYVSILLMAFLNPYVKKLSKFRIPKGLSIVIAYVIILSVVAFSVYAIIPPLAEQSASFISSFPRFMENVGISGFATGKFTDQLVGQLSGLPKEIAKLSVSVFSNLLSLVAVFVFSFYLLVERDNFGLRLGVLFGQKKGREVEKIIDDLEFRLGGWARGQITLMLIVGLSTYVGLSLLGIPYSLPLAIIAGMFEVVPYIGPFISAIPAVLIGLGISPFMGIALASLYFLVQQLENYVFVPKIMQRSAGVHPIITLLALSIGFRLAGIIGLLVSVPIYITASVLFRDLVISKKS